MAYPIVDVIPSSRMSMPELVLFPYPMVQISAPLDGGNIVHLSNVIISAIIGTSINLDNIEIGTVYTAKPNRLPLSACFIAALLSTSACLLGGLSGEKIEHMLSVELCSLMGSCVLIAIGIWTIIQDFFNHHRPDLHEPIEIGFHEWMMIGLAQALTDLSVGIGVGVSNMNIWVAAAFVGAFGFLFLLLPSMFISKGSSRIRKYTSFCSGALLIVIGCIL